MFGTTHIWTFRSLKTLSTHFAGRNTPYLTVSHSENTIPELQEFEPLQDGTAHFWRIRGRNMLFLWTNKSTPYQDISERFAFWKRDSIASANRPPCNTALPIFESFAAWWRDSWASANRSPSWMTQPNLKVFSYKTRFLSIYKSTPLQDDSTNICLFRSLKTKYLAVGNDLLVGRHCLYMNVLSLKTRFLRSSKPTTFKRVKHIFTFRSWQRDSWAWADRVPFMSAPLLSERFATWICVSWDLANFARVCWQFPYLNFCIWKLDPWASEYLKHAWRHCPYVNVSQP